MLPDFEIEERFSAFHCFLHIQAWLWSSSKRTWSVHTSGEAFTDRPLLDRALEVVERRPIWVKGEIDHFPSFSAELI
jgi:hypothetical protein